LLIGVKKRRTGMDEGEQLGRQLSFLDGAATEEEKKKTKKKKRG
jgi:hypothetical protein